MFRLQNYNEFNLHMRWHDYFSIMINEFSVILVRRYEWRKTAQYTFVVQLFGVSVYQKLGVEE